MDMAGLRTMAKGLDVKIGRGMSKADLVRAIQTKEGNFPCFGTAKDYCDQFNCLFRADCLSDVKDSLPDTKKRRSPK